MTAPGAAARGSVPSAGARAVRRREPVVWAAGVLLGGALVLLSAGREWARVTGGEVAGPAGATGSLLVPALAPLAWAGLAGVVAVPAARGLGRRAVGVLIALCGAGALLLAWGATGSGLVAAARAALRADVLAEGTVWPYAALAGGVLLLAGGVVAAVRSPHWRGMSDKYAREKKIQEKDDKSIWDALDRGEDPTGSSAR